MSSELVTVVEVGRSLYVYAGDVLTTSIIATSFPVENAVAKIRANSEDFRHIRISHLDWNALLEWEDRVSISSLASVLDSAWSRRLTVTHLQLAEA